MTTGVDGFLYADFGAAGLWRWSLATSYLPFAFAEPDVDGGGGGRVPLCRLRGLCPVPLVCCYRLPASGSAQCRGPCAQCGRDSTLILARLAFGSGPAPASF